MKPTVTSLDGQIKFMREQASRLRDLAARPGNRWAEQNAAKMEGIVETLSVLRRDLQMTGMNGKRIGERPDQVAIDAIPELQDKKALVCYFATEADRAEFAETLKALMPTARTERIP